MKRRSVRGVLGLVGALTLSWSGQAPAEEPRYSPIQPWVPTYVEERIRERSDNDTVVLPPIPPGSTPPCEHPPDRATILRAMPRVVRGVPYFFEERRDDIDCSVERLVDQIDPPRFYPLVGPAQLHHCHYKCTVSYTEIVESSFPFAFQGKRRRTETVYIDRDHLHLVDCKPQTLPSVMRDLERNPEWGRWVVLPR
jgi:hypothetical protein